MDKFFKLGVILFFAFVAKAQSFQPLDFSTYALNIQAGEFEFPNARGDRGSGAGVPTKSPPLKPDVYSFHIHSDIRYRYSRTNVVSRVANPNEHNSTEVTFQVVLPDSAFISRFLMEIDGKTYEAYVKEKEKAKEVYNEARQRGQTAGLVEINARDSNVFNVNVNVKAKAKIVFNLTYEELLNRKLGRYEHAISVNSEEIKDYKISVNILESQNISVLRVPSLRNDLEQISDSEGNNADVQIERPTGKSANISWSPTERDQIRLIEQGVRGKFIVQYDIDRESDAGEILLMNGYFVHFFATKNVLPLRKHVVFTLDISGSMYGRKMEQLKSAMLFVLDDLKPDDYFNILTFSSGVNLWSPGKHKGIPRHLRRHPLIASEYNVRKARQFVNKMNPSGGTNLNEALKEALAICQSVKPESETPVIFRTSRSVREDIIDGTEDEEEGSLQKLPPNVDSTIVFLTDGQPTVGLTNPESIITSIKSANTNLSIPIYSLAFGNSADFNFIKKLALQNKGFGRKIYEASDSDIQLKGFYKEISSPLLSNITFKYTSDNYTVTKLTTKKFSNMFSGAEIAVAGRFKPKRANSDSDVELISTTTVPTPTTTLPTTFVIPVITVDVGANGRDGRVSYDHFDIIENDISFVPLPTLIPPPPEKEKDLTTVAVAAEPQGVEDLFLERLWAYLTIRQLIDKSLAEEKEDYTAGDDDEDDSDEDDESGEIEGPKLPEPSKPDEGPKTRALRLALKYGFVTPLTSLVVVKPNDSESGSRRETDDSVNLVEATPGVRADSSNQARAYVGLSAHSGPVRTYGLRSRWGSGSGSGSGQPSPMVMSSPTGAPVYHRRSQSYSSANSGGSSALDFPSMSEDLVMGGGLSLRMEDDVSGSEDFTDSRVRYGGGSSGTQGTRRKSGGGGGGGGGGGRQSYGFRHRVRGDSAAMRALLKLTWYHKDLRFLLVNETRYTIERTDSEPSVSSQPIQCNVRNSTAGTEVSGECKHLKDCVMDEFAKEINVYLGSYFCPLRNHYGWGGSFAGVCCSPNFGNSSRGIQ